MIFDDAPTPSTLDDEFAVKIVCGVISENGDMNPVAEREKLGDADSLNKDPEEVICESLSSSVLIVCRGVCLCWDTKMDSSGF